jgi:hypothetical protein
MVAAELALAIGGEGLVACGAGEVVEGLRGLVYQEQVGVPPFLAAGIRAEYPFLALGNLDDLLAAFPASIDITR